ncbi:ABC transporter ATP-binding protein [Priestia aryabhattai]|uniref:ABC transporter ATP-binding protein n=2 Tax=Priestia TaxID=2800373 RepID=A0A345Q491_PRIMG|nr:MULTISPECIES: ABC transporter ATP-binding protein [Priestia]AXI32509.1 ABC transporter ATP-binding protein [Priestia megaterium]MBY0030748.1 ABC transporter ATP-binding protein [Priestia aryabhattai]MBZ6485132.1 ABC transporter ATP-binding protein [Priestia aryabhattai]MDH3111404.1 ABC transporter ATP-binding protein [Priestia aryabhattai]MDH3129675.1 ABC transporter ATP-binding protein [Priestia aryabhattai]
MKKVELVNIGKSYDQKTNVIQDINVTIEPGEFFVLVGPSGCGKSTMLRMIAGLEEVTQGELLIGDVKANKLLPSQRDLSMVFQNYALYPHLTVEQNILFGLHTKKISKQEQQKRCREAAEMLGLSEYLKRKPRQLSGGQRQRVALARAIVTHSPICLMDEPLSNLDAKLRAKMRSEIRQIQRKLGITMIYVTHDQTEAMTMADRMMILNGGNIQQVGRPLDIYNAPKNTFVASFIGSPPMNLSNVSIENNLLVFEDRRAISMSTPHSNLNGKKEVVVGVRPEHIQLATNDNTSFIVEVDNVEILGTETLLTFHMGDKQWMAKWNGQWNIKVGERVPIFIDPKHLFLFDGDTGSCLHYEPLTEDLTVKGAFV